VYKRQRQHQGPESAVQRKFVHVSEGIRSNGFKYNISDKHDRPGDVYKRQVELLLDGKLIARGEAVIVDGNYGLRVTEIPQPVVSHFLN